MLLAMVTTAGNCGSATGNEPIHPIFIVPYFSEETRREGDRKDFKRYFRKEKQLPEVATSEKNRQKTEGFPSKIHQLPEGFPSEIHQLPEGFPSGRHNFRKVFLPEVTTSRMFSSAGSLLPENEKLNGVVICHAVLLQCSVWPVV